MIIDNAATFNVTAASDSKSIPTTLPPEVTTLGAITSENCSDSPMCPFPCSKGFYCSEATGLCQPLCSQWKEFSKATEVTTDVFILLSACIALISGSAVLIIACIRWKQV